MPYPATRPKTSVSADEQSVKTRVNPSTERVLKNPSSSAARCCLRSRRAVSLRCFLLGGGVGGVTRRWGCCSTPSWSSDCSAPMKRCRS